MNIHDACDYIVTKVCEGGESLNALKLQKLMYYVQAWHLAFYKRPLFDGKFQAWIHGPVSRELYDRFAVSKSLYSDVRPEDRRAEFDLDSLDPTEKDHIDNVLEVYAKFTGTQLEEMTHLEEPWREARKGIRPSERCEKEISEEMMTRFYAAQMNR